MISNFDWALFLSILIVSGLSVVFIYSASFTSHMIGDFWQRQLFWIVVGLIVMMTVIYVDYHIFAEYSYLLYFVSLAGLVYVLLFGRVINNTQGWLVFGSVHIQPAEFAKVISLFALARFFSNNDREILDWRALTIGAGLMVLPIALVVLQHDIGTALTFVPVFAGLSFCGGVQKKVMIASLVIVLIAAPVLWINLKDYHRERIRSMLDPDYDVKGIGYQTAQSKIAIGSGRVLGKGLKQGSQSQLGFLPGRHTDFIFSVMAENIGFVGANGILILYLIICFRLIHIARDAKERLGSLIAIGVLSIWLFHVIINVGMALGLVPVIGIPLPFFSYGGSSIISNFMALGLVLNVGMRRYVNQ
ncbi:MAG: rod shape-determining protein RodA [Acidobacteria bacterium]|nr:rod shape-determining protein RodA [Acidobacteriota bacterium]